MKLVIDNIGKLDHADIDISSVTVICGTNGTGKSTVAKSLFSIFNGLSNTSKQIERERKNDFDYIMGFIRVLGDVDDENMLLLSKKMLECGSNIDEVKRVLDLFVEDSRIKEIAMSRYKAGIAIDDEKILTEIINRRLDVEFDKQINNIYNDKRGSIELIINDKSSNSLKISKFIIKDNKVIDIENDIDLKSEAIYIDDFKLIEGVERERPSLINDKKPLLSHVNHLYNNLKIFDESHVIQDIINNNYFNKIFDEVCPGEIYISKESNKYEYKPKDTEKSLSIRNIAEGMKNFLIMKLLINKETLLQNGVLILDEPEIHLHPEWQLRFAELIVLINKYLKTHILINTHSPYFLNAIEVYTDKYKIEKPKYYLSENNGCVYDITDNTERAYAKLAKPFQILEDEWYDE